jgi:hypothetical protein
MQTITTTQHVKTYIDYMLMPTLQSLYGTGLFAQWFSYLLEQVEAQLGTEATIQIFAILHDRLDHGSW